MAVVQVSIADIINNLDFKILKAAVIRGARKSGKLRYRLPVDMRHSIHSVIFPGLDRKLDMCDMDKVLQILDDLNIAKRISVPKHIKNGTWSTYVYKIYQ